MSRYKVNSPWTRDDDNGVFATESADALDTKTGDVFRDGAYRVVNVATGKPAKRGKGGTVPFYGEMAWADAQRLATDLYFEQRLSR